MLRERKHGAKHTVPWSPQGWHSCSGVQAWKPTLQDCPLGTDWSQPKSYEILEALAREPQGQKDTN